MDSNSPKKPRNDSKKPIHKGCGGSTIGDDSATRLSCGESVLDIGCGPGYLCESVAENVGRHGAVVGIDISTDLIALCNRRKASTWLSYAIGDATKVNQPDASFDVVVCTQVAEYVPDVDRVLSEAFRVLKPGGRTIFLQRIGTPLCGI